jgi:hypothetical protein
MAKAEFTPQEVEQVRGVLKGNLSHPVNGSYFKDILDSNLQSMIGMRTSRKLGGSYPADPDGLSQCSK